MPRCDLRSVPVPAPGRVLGPAPSVLARPCGLLRHRGGRSLAAGHERCDIAAAVCENAIALPRRLKFGFGEYLIARSLQLAQSVYEA